MSNRMIISLIVSIPIILSIAGAAYASDAVHSLCAPTETIVFSCEYKNKVASVCASLSSKSSLVYVQYRFGKKTSEISIPPITPFNMDLVNAYTTSGTHGGSETINFRNGKYVYQILNIWDKGPGETNVAIFKNGSKISDLPCKLATDDRILHSFIEGNNFKRGPDLQ